MRQLAKETYKAYVSTLLNDDPAFPLCKWCGGNGCLQCPAERDAEREKWRVKLARIARENLIDHYHEARVCRLEKRTQPLRRKEPEFVGPDWGLRLYRAKVRLHHWDTYANLFLDPDEPDPGIDFKIY